MRSREDAIKEVKAIIRAFCAQSLPPLTKWNGAKEQGVDAIRIIFQDKLTRALMGESALTPELIVKLRQILAQRWEDVAETILSYVANPSIPLNKVFLDVAKVILPFTDGTFLDVIMPGVSSVNQVSQDEEKISPDDIHHFVVAEDKKTLIHVADCLMRLEETQGETLYHTHKLSSSNTAEPLSAREREWVVCHSIEAQQYYKAVLQLNRMKSIKQEKGDSYKGWSCYHYLTYLIEGLRKGSTNQVVKGSGSEYIPGPEVVDAVGFFYKFLMVLDAKERSSLLALKGADKALSHYLDLIYKPARVKKNPQDLPVETCVNLLANDIEDIRNAHAKFLLMRYPHSKTDSESVAMQAILSRVQESKAALVKAMASREYEVGFSYGELGRQRLVDNVNRRRLRDKLQGRSIVEHMEDLDFRDRFVFLLGISKKSMLEHIVSLEDFVRLLKMIPLLRIPDFKQLMQKIINKNPAHIERLLAEKFCNASGFGEHLKWFDLAYLRACYKTVESLKDTLHLLAKEKKDTWFLHLLGRGYVSRLVTDARGDVIPEKMVWVQQSFPPGALVYMNKISAYAAASRRLSLVPSEEFNADDFVTFKARSI